MSRRLAVVIAATVFAGTAVGEPTRGGAVGRYPSAGGVIEDLQGKAITCRDRRGQSHAIFHPDSIIESNQYGTRVIERVTVSNNTVIRTVIYSEDGSLLGRVLTSAITYYDRAELRFTTSDTSGGGLRTTCKIKGGPGLVG